MHNDSKSNPADEASPRVTASTFICNGRWVEGANFLSSLEPEWEDCAQEYVIRQNLSLPPGLLTKKQHLFQEKTATSSVFWQMFSGVAGNKNTFLCCRSARNGSTKGENSLLETPLLSLINQRPGVYGRLVESQTFFLGKNSFLRHFRVKIKTSALEQPIPSIWKQFKDARNKANNSVKKANRKHFSENLDAKNSYFGNWPTCLC